VLHARVRTHTHTYMCMYKNYITLASIFLRMCVRINVKSDLRRLTVGTFMYIRYMVTDVLHPETTWPYRHGRKQSIGGPGYTRTV
jgi:hypothetical protein